LTDRLAPNYQCLTYDLRGFGDSQSDGGGYTGPSEPLNSCYTPAAYAIDLEILLEKLDISGAWLVGHSLGGTIALWAASKLSDRVKGAVCINAGGGIYLKEEFERFRAVGKQLVKMRPGWLSHLPLADFVFGRDSVARSIGRSWGRQRLRDFVRAHPEAALGALLDSTTEAEIHLLPQIVSQLKQPVYFIAGTKDKIMEPKYVLHLASFHWMFQGSGENVLQLPDCGHLAMVEQPDAVASYLQNILQEHT
jgi:pimeloyl-ACP methyl ester carboxylesterase